MVRFLAAVIAIAITSTILAMASMPLGVEAQLACCGCILLAMSLIHIFQMQGPFRIVFLCLGSFIVLRYMFWRYNSKLPRFDDPLDFAVGLIVFGVECYCVLMLFLSLFTVLDPIDRELPAVVPDTSSLSVDVFVPSYNEATEILATTLAAAKRLDYPSDRLRVFLLDDGGTDEKVHSDDEAVATKAMARRRSLQALCVELVVTYVTRSENSHAKAGNLNSGLQNSTGDLIAVFDADHAPSRQFLKQTVGYFTDPKLFLVQTPHFFLNPDPIEKNLGAMRMPAENEMFYGLVQKGLDRWNAAFFCGSAAVLRRDALEQVGGFHGSSITEDAETALELHALGWKSLYVDKPMIAGLQPETFESFIGQRSRWCRGMVQILLLKNPFIKSGLTVAQRMCYASSALFWLFPISRIIFIFAPMAFIFFNLKIYIANQQEFMAYTLMYMVSALMMQSYIFGRWRWPWVSDVYEYIQSVQLFRAVLSVFLDPRRPKFNVTDKGLSLAEDRLSTIAAPYYAIFGLVAVSMATVVYRYLNEPNSRDLLLVVGLWTGLNLVLTGLAVGAVCEKRERRTVPRVASDLRGVLSVGTENVAIRIRDMSYGGLRAELLDPAVIQAKSTGVLRVVSDVDGRILETPVITGGRRISGSLSGVGLRFYGSNADRYHIVAQTVFDDVGRVYRHRSDNYRRLGVALGSARFATGWPRHALRGLYFLLFNRRATDGRSSSLSQTQGTVQ